VGAAAASAPNSVRAPDRSANTAAKPLVELTPALPSDVAAAPDRDGPAWKELQRIENIDKNDTAARIAATEAFLRDHPNSPHTGRATALLNRAKRTERIKAGEARAEAEEQRASNPDNGRQQLLENMALDLVPLYKSGRFLHAAQRIEVALRDKKFVPIQDWLKREKKDFLEMMTMRKTAYEALRKDVGNSLSVRINNRDVTGKLIVNAATGNLQIEGHDGDITPDKMDIKDVNRLNPLETGAGRADDLRRHGYLLFTAGADEWAKDRFEKAAAAGVDVTDYMQWLELFAFSEYESNAMNCVAIAERQYAAKRLPEALQAYRTFEREWAKSRAYAEKSGMVKQRITELEKAVPQP
jgi:hypothetical protein